ncbi:putative trans-sialidase, partial [Trypanosoma cruzi]
FSTLISASSYTMPSECRRGGRATKKVSCYEATAIERTFRGEGPVQCLAVGVKPRCLNILEADGARFPAGRSTCLWKLADPAAAEIASWHYRFDVEWRLGFVRSDSCAVRCFSVWGKPCHRNRI